MDPDTDDGQLVYEVTAEPKHGFLESKVKPGSAVTSFTQGTSKSACLFGIYSNDMSFAAQVTLIKPLLLMSLS